MAEQQELNLETMSLAELKAAALAEEAKEPEVKTAADLADVELPPEDAEVDEIIVKSEIDLGDGSGIQVFTGRGATELDALRAQNSKILEAQRNATIKIRDLSKKIKVEDTRTSQQKTDDEYVIAQRLQKEPTRAIRDVVTEVITEREAAKQRDLDAQQRFVDSHPDFVADVENGRRMFREAVNLGVHNGEWNDDNLEKAYQSLKASGLLKIKAEEAGGTTEEETKEAERIAQPKVEATQSRSPRKASTVSLRGGSAPVVKTGPTEDELYSMPLSKLKQIANEQLAKAGAE